MTQEERKQIRPSTDASARRIARVYADALVNAAAEVGQADSVVEELSSLVLELYPADPNFEEFICSGAIGRDRKTATFRAIFEGRSSDTFLNFLFVLNNHGRLELLRTILAAALEIQDERHRRVRVMVRSAVPLADAQRNRLLSDLRNTLKLEPILESRIEPELLGGVIIRVADWLYDSSIKTELEHIRNQLVARSSHEIQSRRERFSTAS
jgi:F-type H+-transporting ATPase subunit delta